MTLQDVKTWIESLPPKALSYTIVSSKETEILGDEEFVCREDQPIADLGVDADSGLAFFFTDPSEDSEEQKNT
jgi:hypothetical protein